MGTIPVRRGALTRAGDDSDINFAAARNLTGTDFGDFLDLVLLRWRRATDDSVKCRLFEGATTVGPKLVEPLLVRMDSHDVEDRIAAHALLKFATGVDHGFDPAAPREKREDAVVAWQGWWLAATDRLFYDPATKRLATTKSQGRVVRSSVIANRLVRLAAPRAPRHTWRRNSMRRVMSSGIFAS